MAYVPVPKDFSKIKTKLALNLTKRQIICFSLAGICGVPVYLLTKAGLGTDVAATLMIRRPVVFSYKGSVRDTGGSSYHGGSDAAIFLFCNV